MTDRPRWAVLRRPAPPPPELGPTAGGRPAPPPYAPDLDLITGIESGQRAPGPAPEPEYTTEEIAELWRAYKTARCGFCGGAHRRECPRVRSITRYPDGRLNVVTYFRHWDDSNVLWPEDIPGPDPEPEGAP